LFYAYTNLSAVYYWLQALLINGEMNCWEAHSSKKLLWMVLKFGVLQLVNFMALKNG